MAINPIQMVLQSLMQQTPQPNIVGDNPSEELVDELNYIPERMDVPDTNPIPMQFMNMVPQVIMQLARVITPDAMGNSSGRFSIPQEYLPQLPMPSQRGTKPTARTPHPSDQFDKDLEAGKYPDSGGDQWYADKYDEYLQRELLRKKIPGHLYSPYVPSEDPYSINPGLPPLGGANQENWYPGSGSLDRDDHWGGGGYPGSGEGIPMY